MISLPVIRCIAVLGLVTHVSSTINSIDALCKTFGYTAAIEAGEGTGGNALDYCANTNKAACAKIRYYVDGDDDVTSGYGNIQFKDDKCVATTLDLG